MKKMNLVLLMLLVCAAVNSQTNVNPIIKSYGMVSQIPHAAHKPDQTITYKIIVELTENAEKPDSLNEYLEAIATLINLHAAEGVQKEKIHIVTVLRKSATYAVMGHELYKEKFKVENPNEKLLKELQETGVEFFVCGQSMIKRNISEGKLMPGIKTASSGLTALTTYQLNGYAVIKF